MNMAFEILNKVFKKPFITTVNNVFPINPSG